MGSLLDRSVVYEGCKHCSQVKWRRKVLQRRGLRKEAMHPDSKLASAIAVTTSSTHGNNIGRRTSEAALQSKGGQSTTWSRL